MKFGKVIVLQGPSSAGKSTLATALQRSLDEYWWAFEADDVTRMQPTGPRTGWWEPTPAERPHPSWNRETRLARWWAGYAQGIATIAKTGSYVLAVGGWLDADGRQIMASALDGIDAFCVGVTCPLAEVEQREAARGDRKPGYARSHYDRALADAPFDALVDTAALTTDACVGVIRQMLANEPRERFFARVRKESHE